MPREQGHPVKRLLKSARSMLPAGSTLPDDIWLGRHRGIVVLLWLHVPALFLFALARGNSFGHSFFEACVVATPAVAAVAAKGHRRLSMVFASVGLMVASAELVHLSGGVIEAHFHFFIMVGVVVLYQDWWPFLVAIGFVVLHHGVMGMVSAHDVYNHAAAWNNPWKWAAIHGVSILGMSGTGIAAWRLNELLQRRTAERQQQLAEAQELARMGSWEWNVGTGQVEWSDEQYRLLGLAPGQVQPSLQTFLSRVLAEDVPAVEETLRRAVSTAGGFSFDFRVMDEEGTVRWLHARGDVVDGAVDEGLRMRGSSHDITERKEAERALREARDEAMEASRLKSQFLANTSHEIRTPMTVVMGMNELLLETELDETQRKFVEAAGRASEALLMVINDILDFSKIEAGKLELDIDEFTLGEVVEEVRVLMADTAASKGLELLCVSDPELPDRVRGDAPRLRQIVLNLASNAVKFTDEGSVTVRALRPKSAAKPDMVRFEVTDTGIGIAAVDTTRLFEPFSQVDASTTRRHGGTGLGLAISAELTRAMGGDIGVQSTPGAGSTFWLEVPLPAAGEPVAVTQSVA